MHRIKVFSHLLLRIVFAFVLLHVVASSGRAIPLSEYHRHVQQAVTALDTLVQSDEEETDGDRSARVTRTLTAVRAALPESDDVDWEGSKFKVNNSWLHRELDRFEKASGAERAGSLTLLSERLQAIAQRLAEIERAQATTASKAEASKKLTEILARPEYARNSKEPSAISRLARKLAEWLRSLLPKRTPVSGQGSAFTPFAQVFVILLALAVITYAIKLLAPRLVWQGRAKKKAKPEARIVLGEKVEPDQTAVDLLADAEALARRGDLRAAIRKAYIALLVELGERKIISLAQHKTNRDYLGAVSEWEPLYGNVKQLTESFERHWYGLANATEADWLAFRAGYKQALVQ